MFELWRFWSSFLSGVQLKHSNHIIGSFFGRHFTIMFTLWLLGELTRIQRIFISELNKTSIYLICICTLCFQSSCSVRLFLDSNFVSNFPDFLDVLLFLLRSHGLLLPAKSSFCFQVSLQPLLTLLLYLKCKSRSSLSFPLFLKMRWSLIVWQLLLNVLFFRPSGLASVLLLVRTWIILLSFNKYRDMLS